MSKLQFFTGDRLGKIILYMAIDAITICFALAVALSLWNDGTLSGRAAVGISAENWLWYQTMCVVAAVLCIIVFSMFNMYNNLWKYASIDEVLKIFLATLIIFFGLFLFDHYFLSEAKWMILPKRLLFFAWTIDTTLFFFSRFGYRMFRRGLMYAGHMMSSKAGCKRVLVVGAGFAGYGVIRGMLNSRIRDKYPILVVDKDGSKNNANILGIRVVSEMDRIPELVDKFAIDEIIIAMPSATEEEMQFIIQQCTQTDCSLKILPPLSDVSEGTNQTLRDIHISDLLYRSEVQLDTKNIKDYLSGRTVLVTGGGGSIGSELTRQIAKFTPAKIVIVDIYENNAYELTMELRAKYVGAVDIEIRIGSVRDKERMCHIFEEFRPHVVFHAAAHKHVPLMEDSPAEAVKNNVFGTKNVMECANEYGVERFVLLSTDKAVNPTSVMGATKRITELIMQSMARKSKTKYMAVRFGNVLGSNGSVIPLFKKQILNGGPVTVTHPDMERFFMTIPEAAQLVLQTAGLGQTGKIFVLDMGSPVKIDDLARNMIKLSGLKPDRDIKIEYVGLRKGEKLYEELILDEEMDQLQKTCHNKIMVTKPIELDYTVLEEQLKQLWVLATTAPEKVEAYLHVMVPNFNRTRT